MLCVDELLLKYKLVIFSVMCVKVDYEFKVFFDGGDGYCMYYRYDLMIGKEFFFRDLMCLSVCFVNFDVDLVFMEEFVMKMVNVAIMDRFVEYVRNFIIDVLLFEY